MKKLVISFTIMCSMLFAIVGVFASSYTECRDSYFFRSGYPDNAYAILMGKRDNSTDRLSNVSREYKKYGNATIEVGTIERPSQFTAKMYVLCWYNAQKGDKTLSI